MKRIAFVVQLPKKVSPAQRFRFEAFEPLLAENGFKVDTYSFFSSKTYDILYKKGYYLKKIVGVLNGTARRFLLLTKLHTYDFVFLQREFMPVGPPIFEFIAAKILKTKIIYDFDDSIWLPNASVENKLAAPIKAVWKIAYICKWSYKVSAGNDFLCNYARKHTNAAVFKIPTVVDTVTRYNRIKQHAQSSVTVGWTGSFSTLKYLDEISPAIRKLQEVYDFKFVVIADKRPDLDIKSLEFIQWNAETEIDDLMNIDIGVMPLWVDPWTEGKCGFKLIQYMALGIPALASSVGVNKIIIDHGVNGFICNTSEDWYLYLSELLSDAVLRQSMGLKGRQKIADEYSHNAIRNNFLKLFS
jgi:glycosyltransferase involved in cell wall biosynthesis